MNIGRAGGLFRLCTTERWTDFLKYDTDTPWLVLRAILSLIPTGLDWASPWPESAVFHRLTWRRLGLKTQCSGLPAETAPFRTGPAPTSPGIPHTAHMRTHTHTHKHTHAHAHTRARAHAHARPHTHARTFCAVLWHGRGQHLSPAWMGMWTTITAPRPDPQSCHPLTGRLLR